MKQLKELCDKFVYKADSKIAGQSWVATTGTAIAEDFSLTALWLLSGKSAEALVAGADLSGGDLARPDC